MQKKYTKSDSTRYNAYEKMIALYPENKGKGGFLHEEYEAYKNPKASPSFNPMNKNESYKKAKSKELSNFVTDNAKIWQNEEKSFREDKKIFKKDADRFNEINKSLDLLQASWDVEESKSDDNPFKRLFNLYDKESSMGIQETKMDNLREERDSLNDKLYNKKMSPAGGVQASGGARMPSGEQIMLNREESLSKLKNKVDDRNIDWHELILGKELDDEAKDNIRIKPLPEYGFKLTKEKNLKQLKTNN